MRDIVIALVLGMIFGLGLAISGMMNPAKVLNFLDVTGDWDATLAFVMGGGLLVSFPGFWWLQKKGHTVFGGALNMPTKKDIDLRLIVGAVLFGIGWGMVGLCPGPAIAALAIGAQPVLIFVGSMLAGMLLYRFMPK